MARAATVGEALAGATQVLAAAGLLRPRDEAIYLLAHLLGVDRGGVLVRRDEPIAEDLGRQFDRWIARRAAREPAQHLVGAQGFYGLELRVDRRVLIPRPETELLVETLLQAGLGETAEVVDLGTGSGCVAIAVASRRPGWRVTALDRSPEALAVARLNVRRHGLEAQVDLQLGDMLRPPDGWRAAFDAVVSNPPYVSEAEWCRLEPEVRDHDPRDALVAGPRGDEILVRLAPVASGLVRPGGVVAFEVGAGQAAAVEAALVASGLEHPRVRRDLAGIERVVAALRPAEGDG